MRSRITVMERLEKFCLGSVDALPLRVFEVLFTGSFLVWMGRCFLTWREWLTNAGFHLTTEELEAMGYPSALPLLPVWAVPVLAMVILAGGMAHIMNRQRRLALLVLFLCALYVQGVDFMAAFTLNKLFVGVYGILLLSPGYEQSPGKRKVTISAVPLRVIQATLILQYFAAGLAKATHGDWLHGSDVLYTQVQGVYRTDVAAWMLRTLPVWSWGGMQHFSLAFELGAPLLFCVRRLRPIAFIIGMGFHFMIALLMKDLIFFTLQMWSFYALFISSDEWERMARWGADQVKKLVLPAAGTWVPGELAEENRAFEPKPGKSGNVRAR